MSDDRDEVVLTMTGVGMFDYPDLWAAVGRLLTEASSTDGQAFTLRFRRPADPGVLAVPYCPRWTKDRPTVPGWYWVRGILDAPEGTWIVRVIVRPSGVLQANNFAVDSDFYAAAEFAGPIPPPEPGR